jgi:hypothetical protein
MAKASTSMKNLQEAIKAKTGVTAPVGIQPRVLEASEDQDNSVQTPVRDKPTAGYMAPSREGKTNITAYLSPDFKSSLRMVQAQTGKSLQTIIAESLNDTFIKYNVPTVRQD